MMTLKDVARKLRSHADFVGSLGGSGELMDSVDLGGLADAIDVLSQPQPVAQGEIKAWGHRNDPANVISDRNKREMERYEGINGIAASVWDVPFYAAPPTIPAGHRVVPSEDKSSWEGGDSYDDGYKNGCANGWNACRDAILAAAPDAGGV